MYAFLFVISQGLTILVSFCFACESDLDTLGCTLQNIHRQRSFDGVPRDLIQQVLDELVRRQLLSPATLELFSDCALQVLHPCI